MWIAIAAVAAVTAIARCRRVFAIEGGAATAVCPSGREGGAQSAGAGLRGRLQGGRVSILRVMRSPPASPLQHDSYRTVFGITVFNRAVSFLTTSRRLVISWQLLGI